MSATQRPNTGRSAQFIVPGLAVAESESAGDTTGSTAFVATAATVTFSMSNPGLIQARAFSTAVRSGAGNAFQAVSIALQIDGTTYTAQSANSFGNSVGPSLEGMCVFKDILVGAGSHTVTLMFAEISNGSGASGVLQNSHLSVVYPP